MNGHLIKQELGIGVPAANRGAFNLEAFQEGFDANAKDKAAQKAAFDKMLALVPDVKEGSTLTFTYLPGKGTTLQVADKELGVFEGKGFADAVFSIWLGPKPPSEDLRKGMLG